MLDKLLKRVTDSIVNKFVSHNHNIELQLNNLKQEKNVMFWKVQ